MIISRQALLVLLPLWVSSSNGFSVIPHSNNKINNRGLATRTLSPVTTTSTSTTVLFLSDEEKAELNESFNQLSEEEKKEAVGNLVADDEWQGLSMELSELVRVAIVEDMKKNTRDFLGKDDYKVGDITKEIDDRVKGEVAKIRNKEEYELGDFVMAMDEMSKSMTEELTGKEYEAGDLSKELDKRVKGKMAEFAGKDSHEDYELGDVTREVDNRVRAKVEEFTGKPYEFGDITAELENRRKSWMKEFLGEEAAQNYVFGDLTKKAIGNFTGKDEYQFGDVSKKILGDLFGKRKTKGKGSD